MARTSLVKAASSSGLVAVASTASACRAQKILPAGEAPAWKRTGVRCGEGCDWENADVLLYSPLKVILWILEGS